MKNIKFAYKREDGPDALSLVLWNIIFGEYRGDKKSQRDVIQQIILRYKNLHFPAHPIKSEPPAESPSKPNDLSQA